MKKLALALIAAVTLGAATPAVAQVYIGAGDVGVKIGRDHDRHDWRRDRGRHEGWRHRQRYAECRVIKEREVRPSGRVIITTRRICD